MDIFNRIQESINEHHARNAFLINSVFYTYADLAESISKIRRCVRQSTGEKDKHLGLITNDDLETYASIVALWLEGKAYVPLNPESPKNWNQNIIEQAGVLFLLDSSDVSLFNGCSVINTKQVEKTELDLTPRVTAHEELAYILFTSGTTGSPKGVPITRENLTGIINSFEAIGFDIDREDRCLQMFEISFDVSVVTFIYPILKGACIYTIPRQQIKYTYVYDLLDQHKLTFLLVVPSLLHYLRPYFEEIRLPDVKYTLLTAEAFPIDLAEHWSQCIPEKARIFNLYGPTENTVFSTYYEFKYKGANKSSNGILSIGKPMEGTDVVVINDKNELLGHNEKGQLCLCGQQLTPGYWNNEKKNEEAFIYLNYNGVVKRFYKTGDLCSIDDAGDIMYSGRLDFQAKIQGFRVELSEIEFQCKAFLKKVNIAVLTFTNKIGNSEIGLAVESTYFETSELISFLQSQLPVYMIPSEIIFEDQLPLNVNGKINIPVLRAKFQQKK